VIEADNRLPTDAQNPEDLVDGALNVRRMVQDSKGVDPVHAFVSKGQILRISAHQPHGLRLKLQSSASCINVRLSQIDAEALGASTRER
jgi:hypothetical protein